MSVTLNAVSYIKKMMSVLGLNLTTGFRRIEYDDVFPGSVWELPQGATAPGVNTYAIAGLDVRLRNFNGVNIVETMSNSFEVVHGTAIDLVNDGTLKMEVHVHGRPSTTGAGVAVMQVAMVSSPGNDGPPVALGTSRCVFTIEADQQFHNLIAGAEFDPPAGGFHIGDIISFNVFRNPADDDDTYEADFLFEQCAMHVPFDGRGSRTRYEK